MRIAFFTDSFRPTHDGVAHFLSALAAAMGRQGHDVRVFAPRPPGAPREERAGRVEVRRYGAVPMPYYPQYRWALWPYSPALGSSIGSWAEVVHVQTPGPVGTTGVLAAKRNRLPLVGTFHTNLKEMQKSLPNTWAVRTFFRWGWRWNGGVYARCDRVTVPALAARDLLEGSFLKSWMRAPVQVLPNGIDTGRFRPGLTDPDWGRKLGVGDRPWVTFLGRLTRDKGVHTLLDAAKLLPPSTPGLVIIAGDGPERGAIEARLAAEADLRARVRYLGPVSDDEKPALLSQSRAFVLPSVADIAPITLLEAMASGTLCIAARDGGPAEMLDGGRAGWLVDARDPREVAGALARALEGGNGREAQVRRAREKVDAEFSIDRTARELVRVYASIPRR